jgi:GR25 family glycosyltransferase involved in LPS biosynthesis
MKHFLQESLSAKIPFEKIERIEAIDGKVYQLTQEEEIMFECSDYKRLKCKNGIIGNQLSHYKLWQHIVDEKIPISVIFQDDVVFGPNFMERLNCVVNELPPQTEVVWIGQHMECGNAHFVSFPLDKPMNEYPFQICDRKVTEHIGHCRRGINPCSLAYIITYQGAQNLIADAQKRGFPRATDGNMNDYLEGKDIMYGTFEVLCTGNPSLGTDVFV